MVRAILLRVSILVFLTFCMMLAESTAFGELRGSNPHTLTYDLSLSAGTYNKLSYTEANLGLNWSIHDWLVWRNALFSRFGSGFDTVAGLDTSIRAVQDFRSDSGVFGLDFFAGPGLRFASPNSNAAFAEAGIGFKLGGLYLGGGIKSLYYVSERKDSLGNTLDKNDTLFFIILSGGGAF